MYYDPNAFASIQSHCATNCHKQRILLGDINARLGTAVNELAEITEHISYERIDHSPRNDNPSPHGRRLLQICHDNKSLVINNLRYGAMQWKGSLTYRMRDSWKSELDLSIVSKSLIECVDSLQVDQSTTFPSDHAPVSAHLTLKPHPPVSEGLFRMATSRADHSPVHIKKRCLTKRPIRIGRIDSESFVQYMQDHPPGPVTDPCDSAQLVTDIMYDGALTCCSNLL